MAQDAEAGMSVLIAIGFDEAPVMVAAYDVGLQARHNSYIQLVCVVVKGNRNRLWCGFGFLVIRRNRLVTTLEQLPRSGLSHLIHIDAGTVGDRIAFRAEGTEPRGFWPGFKLPNLRLLQPFPEGRGGAPDCWDRAKDDLA